MVFLRNGTNFGMRLGDGGNNGLGSNGLIGYNGDIGDVLGDNTGDSGDVP